MRLRLDGSRRLSMSTVGTILARHRDKVVLFTLLERLCAEEPGIFEAMDQSVAELNENLDALDDFLNQQSYRLAYWKTADQQLSYRRFFDVNTLIGPARRA